MKYLEIDCEAREEITAMRRLIRKSHATVVSEKTIEGNSFSHLIWVQGTEDSLYEIAKFLEPNISFDEALDFIDSDTKRFNEESTGDSDEIS